ncbi:uncharacterized protein N0V89_003190 [Didymosphaeria variabile]|uniref:Uncharacterized protein n=1 Tax=Didymosphaeria variabile TaxID=1932322 RepID=A0A9W8XTI5_9PLEO|nr:uncharacterized protein N0V89_003190 [Didymosphaeria variabile]KAJ4358606.1 hypothetical protein N0V89_003190 [Didymosphaeria variabile]
MRSVFPVPLIDLLLVNRQVHDEVKDLLYSTVPFTVDVRKDGTFMCGRRLLEPRRADGSSHYVVGDVDKIKERFLRTFDWAAVKNYNVDILVENWKDDTNRGYHTFPWDEEVEIYDIRDYIGVVISGILSKACNLCRLNVRLGFSKFIWTEEELYTNIRTLVGPFKRLRNVRQPRFLGVYEGTPQTNFMISLPVPGQAATFTTPTNGSPHGRPSTPLCSVPQLPIRVPLFVCAQPGFAEYRSNWERWIASASTTSLISKPPIRAMFTELKEFYTRLAATVPDVTARNGRHAFLHRARVAREQENVEAFRHLRNELIGYWEAYLEQEERKKDDMNRRLSRMLDVDVYPASWDEDHACIVGASSHATRSTSDSSSQSPIIASAESWRNAAKRSPPEKLHSTYPPSTSLTIQHQSHSQPGSSRCNAGSNAQDPVVIDLADDDDYIGEKQRAENIRLQTAMRDVMRVATQSRQPLQPQPTSLHSPTSSIDQLSPRNSQATLQPSKDQQPMALNPQLHLEAAMSHRRQIEMQAHRARAMQEAAGRQAMAQAQALAQRMSVSGYPPVTMQPQTMLQSQYPDVATQVPASASSSASSSFSSGNELPLSAARETPVEVAYNQQQSPDRWICYDQFPNKQVITDQNMEPAVHVYETSSQKRPAPDTEEIQVPDGKRQRVDSGMGWADEGYGTQRELGEDENEAVAVDVQMVYHQQDTNRGQYRECGAQVKSDWKGKGKGKARAEGTESVCVD